MKARTLRQRRYWRLKDLGFCTFEARELSSVGSIPPYLRLGAKRRYRLYQAFKGTDAEFEAMVKQTYYDNDWVSHTKDGIEILSPWAMLRSAKDRYEADHPEDNYTSPWVTKSKTWTNFTGKYNTAKERAELRKQALGDEKYPTGAAYKRKGK